MNSSYCFTVSICEFDFDPALHVVLNENDWRKNWQGLDMFGCLECSSLNRNKHWFFFVFPLFHSWKSFKRHMLNMRSHSDSKGFEIKRPNDSIYSFPCPDCMCHVNRTEDSRSSSATWSAWRQILMVVSSTGILWTHHIFQFLHLVILSFFPLPTWWERIHFNIGSFKDLFEFTFIRLFPTNRYRETATCNFLYMMPEDADYILSLRGLPWVLTEHCFNTCCCSCCI